MHTNLILWLNPLNTQVRTLVVELFTSSNVVLSRNSYCNTISQSIFVSFAMHTARPLLN